MQTLSFQSDDFWWLNISQNTQDKVYNIFLVPDISLMPLSYQFSILRGHH